MKPKFKLALFIICHVLAWAVFIFGTIYAFNHSETMVGDYSELARSFQGVLDFFAWMICTCFWVAIYSIFTQIHFYNSE